MRFGFARGGIILIVGLVIMVSADILMMVLAYRGVTVLTERWRTVSELEVPQSAAAYEMEINVLGTGFAVLKYLDTADPRYVDRVRDDAADFSRYRNEFLSLAELELDEGEKELAGTMERLYADYLALGRALMDTKDRQNAILTVAEQKFSRIDELFDRKLRARTIAIPAEGAETLLKLMRLRDAIADVHTEFGYYLRTRGPVYRARMATAINRVHEAVKDVRADQQWATELSALFEQAVAQAHDALRNDELIQADLTRFRAARDQIDEVLDEQIQAGTTRDLEQAQQAAKEASAFVVQASSILIPIALVCGVAPALMVLSMLRTTRKYLFELEEVTVRLKDEIGQREQTERALQGLSQRLVKAQEDERRRIARELHDQIGQLLTALKIDLQVMDRQVAIGRVDRLADSIGIVSRVLEQVRTLSLDLRPPALDDLGLVAAIRWHMDQHGQRTGISTKLLAGLITTRWSPDIEITAFRIFQEALTNIARHSHAKHVQVELQQRDEVLRLAICDDGVGFDARAARLQAVQGTSFGLLSMQERASLAGGTLNVQSKSDGGTQIEVLLPLQHARSQMT